MKVSWKVTRQRLPPPAAWSSLTPTNARTFSTTRSQLEPSITRSWVSPVAPFHDTFTSEPTGAIRSAHARAPRPGKVPLVVRLSFTPYSTHRSMISSICR